ncbi:MAG: exodeoxyribonuclease III [Methylotenera sp.]|nr:exodeoxyribonuclease III [Oligoflexia bacterium]
MKLISWNVNGIRAASKHGFGQWFENQSADVVCVQEIKAFPEQLEEAHLHPMGYHSYWNSAVKPGYSGVAIYSKKEPIRVTAGFSGIIRPPHRSVPPSETAVSSLYLPEYEHFDTEGRVIVAEYADFTVINAYFPNSQREHTRLGYKVAFCDAMMKFCKDLVAEGKNVVLCGDFNIAHQEIDLKNPKTNLQNAGFLPEERQWMSKFLKNGFVDTFRHFEKGGDFYTWWSYRPGVREKNIGWRLDYHCVNQELADRLHASKIQHLVRGSDHCPVLLELKS